MIILARHGNTFEQGSTAVWVGAASDLPLTTEGHAQAKRLAAELLRRGFAPATIISGPLQRTRASAEAVAATVGQPVEIDADLTELDYGAWEGLTTDAVAARFGMEALTDWESRLGWQACFGESEQAVDTRVRRFLDRAATLPAPVFACTSNGILRFVRKIVEGRPAGRAAKVATGAYCLLDARAEGLRILEWNVRPNES
ncbi:histidine phosphatase family protein [Sphingomonas sp. ID0503]|uniref:histidine phosphatase family protein n=1 Tax=Sphingomonas sp. ID0503 TaxID=3399691 RepID=UPI003AFB2D3F